MSVPSIIIKADDLIWPVSEKYKRFFNYIEEEQVKASIGIVARKDGASPSKQCKRIIKKYDRSNLVEFWNHGFDHECNREEDVFEFHGTDYSFQLRHLTEAQEFAKKELKIKFHTFGAPYNRFDQNTSLAVRAANNLNIWFFGDNRDGIFTLNNKITAEYYIAEFESGIDVEIFRKQLTEKNDCSYVVFQVHPEMWSEETFLNFDKIIQYCKIKKAKFTFPKEIFMEYNLSKQKHKYLDEIVKRLFFHRSWSYLRFFHLRESFCKVSDELETVLSIGCGRGYAELALAIEFPHIHFHLTDVHTYYEKHAGKLADEWALGNVTFGIQDITHPISGSYDFILNMGILALIKDDKKAVKNMYDACNKYIYSKVQYASKEEQRDKASIRAAQGIKNCRVGYHMDDLNRLFPKTVEAKGCYWHDAGMPFKRLIDAVPVDFILKYYQNLADLARTDGIRGNVIPRSGSEAAGICVLAKSE